MIDRAQVRELMASVVAKQGKQLPSADDTLLDTIGFRSLDFSELALLVEDELDQELNFDAPGLRQIRTIGDVLDLMDELQSA